MTYQTNISARENLADEGNNAAGENPCIDLSLIRTFSDGDSAIEKEFINAFIEQSDKIVQMLQEARIAQDSELWKEKAHMLKGGAGTMGAETLTQLCDKAQRTNLETSDEYGQLFDHIKLEYERVRKSLLEIIT